MGSLRRSIQLGFTGQTTGEKKTANSKLRRSVDQSSFEYSAEHQHMHLKKLSEAGKRGGRGNDLVIHRASDKRTKMCTVSVGSGTKLGLV